MKTKTNEYAEVVRLHDDVVGCSNGADEAASCAMLWSLVNTMSPSHGHRRSRLSGHSLAQIFGHGSLDTTKIYSLRSVDQLGEASENLNF